MCVTAVFLTPLWPSLWPLRPDVIELQRTREKAVSSTETQDTQAAVALMPLRQQQHISWVPYSRKGAPAMERRAGRAWRVLVSGGPCGAPGSLYGVLLGLQHGVPQGIATG